MNTKQIQIMGLLLFCVAQCITIEANGQATAEERATKLTQWMETNLHLNEDQVAHVQGINLKYAQKNEGLRSSTETRAQKFKKLKGYDAEKDSELKKLFTEEQYKTYQAKKEEIKEEFKAKAKEKK